MALNRKKSGVNGVELENKRRQRLLTGKIAALTALNRGNSGVNGVEPENGGVGGVYVEK